MNTKELELKLKNLCAKEISLCSDAELYNALLRFTEEESNKKFTPTTRRKLYYISAEFLIGKLLSNNLINLNLYDTVKEVLENNGSSCVIIA